MAIGETSKVLPKSDIKARERTNITFDRKKRLTLPYSKSKINFAATISYMASKCGPSQLIPTRLISFSLFELQLELEFLGQCTHNPSDFTIDNAIVLC